jgi:hypothetical protein
MDCKESLCGLFLDKDVKRISKLQVRCVCTDTMRQSGAARRLVYIFLIKLDRESSITARFVRHREIRSAVKRVGLVWDRTSYIILGGRWWFIIFLKVHVPTDDKTDPQNYSIVRTLDKTDFTKDWFYEELELVFDQFLKYRVEITLRDFSGKIGREFIFKPTIRNESSHEIVMITELRVTNFATPQISISQVYNIRRHK